MKKYLFIILLAGCSNDTKVKTSTNLDVDSIIDVNKKNFELAKEANSKSDSSITQKVENTVKKIDNLETQVENLKEQNNELKNKINNNDDDGGTPYGGLPISPN